MDFCANGLSFATAADEIIGVQENGVKALRVKASVHDGEVYRPGLKYIVQRGAALGDDGHLYVAVSAE